MSRRVPERGSARPCSPTDDQRAARTNGPEARQHEHDTVAVDPVQMAQAAPHLNAAGTGRELRYGAEVARVSAMRWNWPKS
ncbi:hypothetical protein GCM10009730_04530 [Streptomyces albidochromogenes]